MKTMFTRFLEVLDSSTIFRFESGAIPNHEMKTVTYFIRFHYSLAGDLVFYFNEDEQLIDLMWFNI